MAEKQSIYNYKKGFLRIWILLSVIWMVFQSIPLTASTICPLLIKSDEAKENFPDGWETIKPYLRTVKQPE